MNKWKIAIHSFLATVECSGVPGAGYFGRNNASNEQPLHPVDSLAAGLLEVCPGEK